MVGMWKAFAELAALEWIDPVHRPHMVTVQAAGCAPIVRAFGAGAERSTLWEGAQTVADGLRVPKAIGDFLVLRAVRESQGAAVAVGDVEMVKDMRELGRLEGISAAPEGGAALHALRVLIHEGRVKPHDTVVLFNTGGALKYLDVLG
jgi:threonine synthase